MRTLKAVLMLAGALLVYALANSSAEAQHTGPMHGNHRFDNIDQWAREFDAADRDAWQKPDEVLSALRLPADAAVADIGAGTGYFTVRLAKLLPAGVVYAVDIEEGMLAHIAARANSAGLANIKTVRGGPDQPNLPAKVDLVLIVDTYHHIAARVAYMQHVAAALKPGGRVAIVDFRPDGAGAAPKQLRLPIDTVVTEMRAAGFNQTASHDFLPNQYFLVFQRRE